MVSMSNYFIFRRLAAIIYDALIVAALLIIATLGLQLIFNQGQAFSPGNIYYQGFLIVLMLGYFLYFWNTSGQTIGMAAWKIILMPLYGKKPSYQQLVLRMLVAIPSFFCFGIGFWWLFFNKEKATLYDRCSATRLMYFKRNS